MQYKMTTRGCPLSLGVLLFLLTACIRLGSVTTLRPKPAILSRDDVVEMIRENGFHHPADLSVGGLAGRVEGHFQHQYKAKTRDGESVIVDAATRLMWQQAGSPEPMTWMEAKAYAARLNAQHFAGYASWRLPTLTELASLLEWTRQPGHLYIDPRFAPTQSICWSADILGSAAHVWFVYFAHGYISNTHASSRLYVRAVRSM
jgi:Txe/YoeB family toxin of Txe-Axe toxin-antitoxin module